MRILKFRFIKDNKIQGILELKNGGILDMAWEWDTVNQFTGLLDKQGKEIYEGDILIDDNTHKVFEVKWIDAGFNVMNDKCFRIIGNIYENPELLPQAKGDGI